MKLPRKVAVDLRATVPKTTPTDRRPEVDGYLYILRGVRST